MGSAPRSWTVSPPQRTGIGRRCAKVLAQPLRARWRCSVGEGSQKQLLHCPSAVSCQAKAGPREERSESRRETAAGYWNQGGVAKWLRLAPQGIAFDESDEHQANESICCGVETRAW